MWYRLYFWSGSSFFWLKLHGFSQRVLKPCRLTFSDISQNQLNIKHSESGAGWNFVPRSAPLDPGQNIGTMSSTFILQFDLLWCFNVRCVVYAHDDKESRCGSKCHSQFWARFPVHLSRSDLRVKVHLCSRFIHWNSQLRPSLLFCSVLTWCEASSDALIGCALSASCDWQFLWSVVRYEQREEGSTGESLPRSPVLLLRARPGVRGQFKRVVLIKPHVKLSFMRVWPFLLLSCFILKLSS